MPGLFSRLHIWNQDDDLDFDDLNNEFNNIIANIDAIHSEGYSQNLSQMQSTENPGGVGSENLTQPISDADEIQRLRFVINRIIGGAQWYSTPPASLATLQSTISGVSSVPPTRIVSGRIDSNGQPDFIRANTTDVKLLATATPLVVVIDGQQYTFSADITLSGLSAGFSSQNTMTNAEFFGAGEDGMTVGEPISLYVFDKKKEVLQTAGAGTQITSRIGSLAVMKIVGTATEYFVCRIQSTSFIEQFYRGYLRLTTGAPTPISTLVTGETITLLRITYLFLNTSGVLIPVYNEPVYQSDTPTSFSVGDYWFDLSLQMWKTYNGSAWVQANAIFLGLCAQDNTGCLVSRSFEFFENFQSLNEIEIDLADGTSVLSSVRTGAKVCSYGGIFQKLNKWTWDLTTDVDSGQTAGAGYWYLYVSKSGDNILSQIHPNDRSVDLQGFYHPSRPYRCVGVAVAASASSFTYSWSLGDISLQAIPDQSVELKHLQPRTFEATYGAAADYGEMAVSQNVGSFSTSSTSPVQVTNLSITINCTGKRPVKLGLTGNAPVDAQVDFTSNGSGRIGVVGFYNGSNAVNLARMATSTNEVLTLPACAFSAMDFSTVPGPRTYTVQAFVSNGGSVLDMSGSVCLFAYEMA